MIEGLEYHSIIENIFVEVNGLNLSEQVQVNCPMCQERDGLLQPDGKFNLEINTKRRVFRCWKCDEPKFSGSLGKLIKMYGSNFDYELYKSFAGSFSDQYYNDDDIDVEQIVKLPDEMILFTQMDVNNIEHFEAYNYLVNERKIDRDIIIKYKLGFCVSGKYAKRIIIPSYDLNGNVNYFVARTYSESIKKKYDNPKSNKSSIIFNEAYVNWDSTVYLVEGVFEMLSFPVNCIPMLGKTISEALFFRLKELHPDVVIVLDPDAYKASIDLFYLLENLYAGYEDKLRIIKLPNNDDLDELRKNKGHDELIEILRTSRKLTIDDYFEKKLTKYDNSRGYRRY